MKSDLWQDQKHIFFCCKHIFFILEQEIPIMFLNTYIYWFILKKTFILPLYSRRGVMILNEYLLNEILTEHDYKNVIELNYKLLKINRG